MLLRLKNAPRFYSYEETRSCTGRKVRFLSSALYTYNKQDFVRILLSYGSVKFFSGHETVSYVHLQSLGRQMSWSK